MAIKEFYVGRLHVDLGLWEASIQDKKNYIKELFFFLSREDIWVSFRKSEVHYSIINVEEASEDFIKGQLLRSHSKQIKRLTEPGSKQIIKEKLDGVVETLGFYYCLPYFLLFTEEKSGYGLTRKKISQIISLLLHEAIKIDGKEADVDLVFLASEKEFVKKVYELEKILLARFVLFPTNPSKRIYDDIDADLKESNIEKRIVIDKPIPGGSIKYPDGSNGRKYLQMVEDGYAKGKVRGFDYNGNFMILDSEDKAEKLAIDPDLPEENLLMRFKQFAIQIWNKFKP